MDTAAILDGLGNAEGLPEVSIRAARARRGDVAPQLIALVERYVAGDETALAQEKVLFWAFHLLGEWREAAAYRPLARLLALETDEIHEVLGDAVTATAHRVMAGLFDGDPQPLYDVIENQRADSFVRSRMLETLAMLVLDGRLARDAAARYLKLAFARLRPQDSDFVWFGWQSAIAALRLEELSDLVRQAYERELIDPADMGFADFAADLDHARRHPDAPWRSAAPDEFAPFNDTLAEFSTWTFDEDASQPDDGFGADDEWWPDHRVARPAVNPFKDVGRNDPCPCGSGKKFKKCCLG